MRKLGSRYALLTFVALLMEAILGRLELGQWFTPLVYVAPLVLLPTTMRPILVLFIGFLLGLVGDIMMGTAALNVIATMATAMLRPAVMNLTIDVALLRKRTYITPRRVGQKSFWLYTIMIIGVHCIIFFALETLSFAHFFYTLWRVVVATIFAVLFTAMITKIIPRKTR